MPVTRVTRMLGIQSGLMDVLLQGTRFKPAEARAKGLVDEVVESVIGYRQLIARGPLRLVDTPNLASAAAAINLNHQPTPIRQRETN